MSNSPARSEQSDEALALHRLEASRALLRRTMAESISQAVARKAPGPLQKLLINVARIPGLAAAVAALRLLRRGRA
jgi:hypothetical protein